ncbi:hypothetical protein D9758_016855 [Tetrapyrgos nigripes]|uniref:Uncharacterized protein n=1 Tax=Tetrapyrgos nigripes TaxID=182062 RepID=A0A8H5CER7_9AGAR|nr:hypothetical protein D9758_016855 [Tetrapyrgos nigripes]
MTLATPLLSHMCPTPVYVPIVLLEKLHSGESSLTSSLWSGNPMKYLMNHERTWDGDVEREKAAREWGGNECDVVKEDGGMDSLKTGLGIPEGPGAQKVPIYFAVHEFLTLEAAESYVHHVAANTNLDSTGTTDMSRLESTTSESNLSSPMPTTPL